MGYELPASIASEVERYAEETNLSTDEAAVRLIRSGLENTRKPEAKGELTEEEWERLRSNPALEFLWSLPDSVMDRVEEVVRETRGEDYLPRG